MTEFLTDEIRIGLENARRAAERKRSRLRLRVGDRDFPVLRSWEDGLALDIADAPRIRGLVDLYDGARLLMQCLIVASSDEGGERLFEFKRATPALDAAPPDYARDEGAPSALIPKL